MFYDIGKVFDYEIEGFYVEIGVELVVKYKENLVVINVIVFYYGDVEVIFVIFVFVVVVDVFLVVRFGVWSELLENYICCLRSLENILNSFVGVELSYVV